MEEPLITEAQTPIEETVYPSLTERIKSTVADALLILFLMSITAMILDNYTEVPDWARATLFIAMFFIYEPLAQTFGCTLGNYVMGIRTRQESNHAKRLNIFQAYLRFGVKSLLGWISFFTMNSNIKRRAMHDLASGSVMVYA